MKKTLVLTLVFGLFYAAAAAEGPGSTAANTIKIGVGARQIAMGDPEFVPAGNYGLQTLELLGISFIKLQPKLILGSNVRQVLSYVESKNVDAGIVYASDAFCSDSVRVVAIAPDEINETIVFPVAVVSSSKNVQIARAYIDFLFTTEAQEIFKKHGFVLLVD